MPATRLPDGKHDAAFRTKFEIALSLLEQAQAADVAFSAIVADCFYDDHQALEKALFNRRLPHVLARRGTTGAAAACLRKSSSPLSGWPHWCARGRPSLQLFGCGPDKPVRAVCATTNLRSLPAQTTWYLTTNLLCEQAPLGGILRLYGLRN